jgi:hypothetical protein
MNSSKLRGAVPASTSGAEASRIPSAQQSFTSVLQDPLACPLACPFAPPALGALSAPNRASIAPTMHSRMTFGGRPYSAPWNG